MISQLLKSLLTLLFCAFSITSYAYDQKGCMQSIDLAYKTSNAFGAAIDKMSSTMMTLLNSGYGDDDAVAAQLTNVARVAFFGLNSSQVVSQLRQHGTYKQPASIDLVVDSELQWTFNKFVAAKRSFVKFTGLLKNSVIRDDAFVLSQELERISMQIRLCQK